MPRRRPGARLDPAVLGLGTLAFSASIGESAIVPILPTLQDELGISTLAVAALLAATTLGMLVTSMPVGVLGQRVGPRRVLALSALGGAAALLLAAAAPTFWPLALSRLATGVCTAAMWTVGTAVVAAGTRRTAGMGMLISCASAGWLVGPATSGLLADLGGLRLPFLVLGLATLPTALVVLRCLPRDVAVAPQGERGLGAAVHAALVDPPVRGALLAMVVLGVAAAGTGLLAPLALDRNGLSAGAIGTLLAASAAVWVAAATAVGRIGDRRVDCTLMAGAVAVLAAVWALPALTSSSVAIVLFLFLSGLARAAVNTLVFVLAATGRRGAANAGAVGGVINAAWAVAGLVAPLALGLVVDDHLGLAFALVAATMAACAAGIALGARRRVAAQVG